MMNKKEKSYYNAVEPIYRVSILREGLRLGLDTDDMSSMYFSNIENHKNVSMIVLEPEKKSNTFANRMKEIFKK